MNTNDTKKPESILVVKRTDICSEKLWTGVKKTDLSAEMIAIEKNKIFMPRPDAENDPRFKQIIPYLIFTHNDKYFLMQRQAHATEQRLASKYTLGIGGHLREEDMEGTTIFDWALREFHEEVAYNGTITVTPLGVINDDSTEVGKVHIGFAFLLTGSSDQISVKSELKSGKLVTLEECYEYYQNLETWSQMVYGLIANENA